MWRFSSVIALVFFLSLGKALVVTTETWRSPAETPDTSSKDKSTDAVATKEAVPANDTKETSPGSEPTPTAEDAEDKEMEKMMEIQNECNDTFRIENGYIEALMVNGSFPDETDRTPKCFIRCMLERMGVVSEDGVFDVNHAVPPFSEISDQQDAVTWCAADRKETCKCEKSYQFYKCLVQANAPSNKENNSN